MAQDVGEEDGDQHGEEDGVDGGGLDACCVEGEGEEADADVQDFAGDLVFVDLRKLGLSLLEGWDERTNERHFWCMGIKPSGLGLRLISRQ